MLDRGLRFQATLAVALVLLLGLSCGTSNVKVDDTAGTSEIAEVTASEGIEESTEQDTCVPQCTDDDGNVSECGDDGCGGTCGECPPGAVCGEADYAAVGVCFDPAKQCPGICASAGAQCGSVWTGLAEPEDCECGPCPKGMECVGSICCEFTEESTCQPYCPGGECPGVPCHASIGMVGGLGYPCTTHEDCIHGLCYPSFASNDPVCTCPCFDECPTPFECMWSGNDGPDIIFGCFPPCEPDCEGKECGDDGCGGSCGDCGAEQVCTLEGNCCAEDCCGQIYSWPLTLQRVNWLAMGDGGYPGHSLDVDSNPATCSPPGHCSDGIDNALSAWFDQACMFFGGCPDPDFDFAAWLGESFLELWVLMAFPAPNQTVNDAELLFYSGQPGDEETGCGKGHLSCYGLCTDFLTVPSCESTNSLGDMEFSGTKVSAGGNNGKLTVHVPWGGKTGEWQTVELSRVRITADVVVADGKVVSVTGGVIAGAVHEQAVLDWLAPMDPYGIFAPDMDVDGDGVPESLSFGFRFTTEKATVVGVLDEPCMSGQDE